MGKLTIALDGPAGSGKSSVAKRIANELGILYLDTGAMYRAVGLAMLRKGIDPLDRKRVESEMKDTHVKIRFKDGHQQVWMNGEDVTDKIRTPEISKAASDVSAHPAVRMAMVQLQRITSEAYDMILDGRDIGTFVLPDAEFKFYLTATSEERAKRRHLELAEKGIEKSLAELTCEIEQRDYNDSHRELAPLKQAEDAVLIDSTDLTVDEVTDMIKEKIKGREKMNPLYVFAIMVAAFINKCFFFLKVEGRENTDNRGRTMIVSNHVSWYDPIMLGGIFQWKIHFIAKIELFKSRLAQVFLAKLGAFPVARGQGDIGAIRKSFEILKEDKCLGIFPEGTRFVGEMGDFLPGAAAIALKMNAKIFPVYQQGATRIFQQVKVIVGKPFYLKDIIDAEQTDAVEKGTKVLKDTLLKLKSELE